MNGYGVSGIADRLALRDGVFMAIEAKRNAKLTNNQRTFLNQVREETGFAFIVDHHRLDAFGDFLAAFDRSQQAVQRGENPTPDDGSIMLNCIAFMQKELFDEPARPPRTREEV